MDVCACGVTCPGTISSLNSGEHSLNAASFILKLKRKWSGGVNSC